MFNDINNILQFSISFGEILENLFVAFLCGLIVSYFYRKTYIGPGYLNSFVNSQVILSMITAIVIMIIGNNLARAFGLVGAMSIIRFRTAVKETNDIIFIFFALAVGMAAGTGLHNVAIAGSLIVGITFLILTKTNIITPDKKEFLLQFSYTMNGEKDEAPYKEVIDKYCKTSKLINAKSIGEQEMMEYSYYISFKFNVDNTEFIKALKNIKGLGQINLFFDEEYF